MLTPDQYKTLAEHKGDIEGFIRMGSVRNLPIPWLNQMSGIHQQVFNSRPVDFRCPSCLGVALSRLYPMIVEFEEQQRKEAESKIEQEAVKVRGRKPKDWVKI